MSKLESASNGTDAELPNEQHVGSPGAPDAGKRGDALRTLGPRVLKLAVPHSKLLLLGFVALSAGTGINLLFPYIIRAALNQEFGLSLERDLSLLTIALVALFALQALFFFFRHYAFQVVGYKVVTDLRQRLFDSLLAQDIAFFDRSRLGDLLSRLSSDTEIVQRALTINISVALRYSIQVLGGIALMLFISLRLTAVILVLLPVLVALSMWWGRRLRRYSKRMQAELGDAGVVAEEALGAVRTVRIFAGAPYESTRYRTAVEQALSTGVIRSRIAASFSSTMVFLMHSAIAITVWYGGSLVLSGALTLGDLTGFLLYCVIVAVSFGFLAGTWAEFMQAVGAAERIFEIVDSPAHVTSPSAPLPIPQRRTGDIRFEGVSFSYPSRPDSLILHNLTFAIEEGQTVALVGPSGSGKSTVASLIPRFYDPTEGEIRYCGVPLRSMDIDVLRANISVVAQNPQVFSLSIADNIRYGRLDATPEEVRRAAEAANLSSFIEGLPQGLDTPVGDKGIQLSGGERQRVAIARALLKDPHFLILDEATSALDSTNELLVQQALERLMANRSTLVIAHRLSTVQHADLVLVLREGKIEQQGTHRELMEVEGLYRTLVSHQLLD
ncbi:MAG: ATP-binding cassette domain-containing protein [Bdellovibrionales bacterium]|nr:ATP-binding cassette domain-containing protein [Bdellovibrionales bacterium]